MDNAGKQIRKLDVSDEGLKNIRLIATDLDHTLLTESGAFPPGFEERVYALRDKGILFVIASGRALYTLRDIFPSLSDSLVLICDNGGIIWRDGSVLFRDEMKPSDYRYMAQFTEQFAGLVPLICGVENAWISERHSAYYDDILRFFTRLKVVEDISTLSLDTAKYSIYLSGGRSEYYFEEYFRPEFGRDFSVTVGGPEWIDFMNPGINKGSALKHIMELEGIKADEVMAFGDTYNDKEMLSLAGYGFVMANACEDMHRFAGYLAPSNEEFGVIKTIDAVLAALQQQEPQGTGA